MTDKEQKTAQKAYDKFLIHVQGHEDFESFKEYFYGIVTTDDMKYLNDYLLMVLWVQMKKPQKVEAARDELVEKFVDLLSKVDKKTKENLLKWVDGELGKFENKESR